MSEVEDIISFKGEDEVVHFTEYLKENNSKPKKTTLGSSYKEFDKKCGLQLSEVVVVTGHRKQGKTTFVESWVRSMMEADPVNAKTVFLSYETPPEEIANRLNDNPELPAYMPLTLRRGSFEWVEKKCLEAKCKFMAKIVVIDHLGFIVDNAIRDNMSLNIGGCMRRLKSLAVDHRMAIIVLAHQSMSKEGKEASVDRLFGSVAIGQDSDATIVVMRRKNLDPVEIQDFVNRWGENKRCLITSPNSDDPFDEYSANLATVKVDCHRRTGTMEWKKLFKKNGPYMEEV